MVTVSAAEQIIDHAAVRADSASDGVAPRSARSGQPLGPPDPQSHCPWPQRFPRRWWTCPPDFGRF